MQKFVILSAVVMMLAAPPGDAGLRQPDDDPLVFKRLLPGERVVQVRYETNPEGRPIRAVGGRGSSDILLEVIGPGGEVQALARIERGEPWHGSTPILSASPFVKSVTLTEPGSSVQLWCGYRTAEGPEIWCYRYRLPELALQRCFQVEKARAEFTFFESASYSDRLGFVLHWSTPDASRHALALHTADGRLVSSLELPFVISKLELTDSEEGCVFQVGDSTCVLERNGDKLELRVK